MMDRHSKRGDMRLGGSEGCLYANLNELSWVNIDHIYIQPGLHLVNRTEVGLGVVYKYFR